MTTKEDKIMENKLSKLGIACGDFGDLVDAYGLYCIPECVLNFVEDRDKEEIVFLIMLLSEIIRNSKGRVQEIKKSEYYKSGCNRIKELNLRLRKANNGKEYL